MICYVSITRDKLLHSLKFALGKLLFVNLNSARVYIFFSSLDYAMTILTQVGSEILLSEFLV